MSATSADPAPRVLVVDDEPANLGLLTRLLVHERVYKPAWPTQEARGWIGGQRGALFDPDATDALLGIDDVTLLAAAA